MTEDKTCHHSSVYDTNDHRNIVVLYYCKQDIIQSVANITVISYFAYHVMLPNLHQLNNNAITQIRLFHRKRDAMKLTIGSCHGSGKH